MQSSSALLEWKFVGQFLPEHHILLPAILLQSLQCFFDLIRAKVACTANHSHSFLEIRVAHVVAIDHTLE